MCLMMKRRCEARGRQSGWFLVEPDVIPRKEHGNLTTVAVCLLLLTVDSMLVSHMSISPYFFCTPETLINHRSFSLTRDPRSQGQLKIQNTLEGGQPSGGVTKQILGILRP